MPMKIAILEDNEDRRTAMRCCLADRLHQYEVQFFDDASAMIAYLKNNLADTVVVSLDHDLDLKPGEGGRWLDPGTGREIADYLAEQPASFPVIIHTSNGDAAVGMELVLQDAGWNTHRVVPMEDNEWIHGHWLRTIRNAIVGSAKRRRSEQTISGEQA